MARKQLDSSEYSRNNVERYHKQASRKGLRKGILTGIIGVVPLWLMTVYMKAPLDAALGTHWGHFLDTFIIVLYCMALFPAYICLVWGREEA